MWHHQNPFERAVLFSQSPGVSWNSIWEALSYGPILTEKNARLSGAVCAQKFTMPSRIRAEVEKYLANADAKHFAQHLGC